MMMMMINIIDIGSTSNVLWPNYFLNVTRLVVSKCGLVLYCI